MVVDYHKLLLLLILLARLQIDRPIGSNLHHNLIAAVARFSRGLLRGYVSNDVLRIVGSPVDSVVGNRRCVLQAMGLQQSVIMKDLWK